MPSSAFIFRTIRWSAWEGCEAGLEHVEISPRDGGIDVAGMVIGQEDDETFALAYRLSIDAGWRVREARLKTASGRALHLQSNGEGAWLENGSERPDLQGCIDIDIQATPLTNTLPIRRLEPARDQAVDIRLCYVSVPSLSVTASDQRYTALDPGALYRFESASHGGFTADLPVDEDGFVRDYPGLFRRMG